MPSLSEADQRTLLELARRAVCEAVCRQQLPASIPHDGVFSEKHGVFVTLHFQGRLRGCIGVTEGHEPLGEAIVRCAASAALQDPRFAPLSEAELEGLQVELSILSPLAPIRPGEIVIGKHGLMISRGSQRGLLLPQVAVEHHMENEQFLDETCRKAGLPHGAWRDPDTQVLGFTCEVYSEGGPSL